MSKNNIKNFLLPVVIVAVLAITLTVVVVWWSNNSSPVNPQNTDKKEFLILKGRGASQIGQSLHEEDLIKNPLAFKLYVSITGKAQDIQAGEFRLSPSNDLLEVVEILTSPPSELWVTIPEGLRKEEMVKRFTEGLNMNTSEALLFQENFIEEVQGKEGYLFPDTYLLPQDSTAEIAVSLMENTFETKTQKLKESVHPNGLTFEEVVVLASLIEREAKTDTERPVVAGILINRLEIDMALQVDASVQYAVANRNCGDSISCNWWPILTRDDLEIDSPHNTYRFTGLPPTPIASPGLTSIEAAKNPQETPYFYYIHDREGNIHYARTLQEHNENVRVYLK